MTGPAESFFIELHPFWTYALPINKKYSLIYALKAGLRIIVIILAKGTSINITDRANPIGIKLFPLSHAPALSGVNLCPVAWVGTLLTCLPIFTNRTPQNWTWLALPIN